MTRAAIAAGVGALVFALASTVSPAAVAGAPPAVVPAAERIATVLEGKDDGGLPEYPPTYEPPTPGFEAARKELPVAARDLDAHLASNPRDARALVARGRLLRLQYRGVEYDETGVGKPAPNVDPRPEVLALFDRALAADSTRSDAWYGKALTLATPLLFTTSEVAGIGQERFDEALPFARLAHKAAPDDAHRVNLLEHCLLATGADLEAERVRDPVVGTPSRPSQVARILERGLRVPAPPGAQPAPRMRESMGLLVKPRPQDRTPAAGYARMRIYQTLTAPVDSILAFYRTTWPGLDWHVQSMEPNLEAMSLWTRFAMTALRWEEGRGWTPMPIDETSSPYERTDALLLIVEEIDLEQVLRTMPEEQRAAMPDSVKNQPTPRIVTVKILDRLEENE